MNVTIIGANGDIGKEVTKNFLKKDKKIDKLTLMSKSKGSCNHLTSLAQDSITKIDSKNILIGDNPKLIKNSDTIIFCAGEGVNSNKSRREDLLKSNTHLFEKYLKKVETYSPNALVVLVTNPTTHILQLAKKPKNISIIGMGITNDTYRLQKNFYQKFGYNEKNLFMIGDHFTNQEMTLSQIKPNIAKKIIDEENKYFKKNNLTNIYEFIRKKNYELLEKENTNEMFDFVKSVPLKYQGVARQRFVHFLSKTILSTSQAIDNIFESINTKNKVCCEVITNSYLGLNKSILGVPTLIEDSKVVPVELNYSDKEYLFLKKCSEIYKVK